MTDVPSGYVPVKSPRIIRLCDRAELGVSTYYKTKKDKIILKYLGTEQRFSWWKPKKTLTSPEDVVEWMKEVYGGEWEWTDLSDYLYYDLDTPDNLPFIKRLRTTAQNTEEWLMSVETFNRLIKLSKY